MLEERLKRHMDLLLDRYGILRGVEKQITDAYRILEECFLHDGKLLIAGNGGSAADAEHMAGELMKRFKKPRPVTEELAEKMKELDGVRGERLSKILERGLMTIPLSAQESLMTAYMNDVDSLGVFAQQVLGYGRKGDVFLGISTSGNSQNILYAAVAARALEIRVIGLTGAGGGELAAACDAAIVVPETETYRIQELDVPIYHCLCLMLVERFF